MKYLIRFGWLGLLVLAACNQGTQQEEKPVTEKETATYPREIKTYDATTFFKTTSYGGGSISHDGSQVLVSSDETGVFNAYSVPFGGGEMTQLTSSTSNAVFGVSWFPADNRMLFSFDKEGNERNHLWVREEDGAETDLTPGEETRASLVGWNFEGSHFYVMTNERDSRFMDLYRYAADGYERDMVFENNEGWSISDITYDGRWLAMSKQRTSADNDLYLVDLTQDKPEPVHITPHEGNIAHNTFTFTPDSKQLIYGTDEHGEFTEAWTYDLASGEKKPYLKADWDISFIYFSRNGKYRVHGINQDAKTAVTILDTATNSNMKMPELPPGSVTGMRFSRDESRATFYLNSDIAPSNLYSYDLASGSHTQLTDALNPEIDKSHMVQSEVIRYKSFDGLEIPSLLYRPWTSSPENKVPALIWVHGGPGGQSRQGYSAMIQHMVNNGYAILAVNNRGSSGYGKTFFHMDDKKHGDVDLKDCIWGRKYMEGLDWVDKDKIGIIGGSYGGYMVAAALTFEPDAFDVGVNIFGVTNWLRTLESIPDWWESFREALYDEMGDPATDRERLHKISPLFHAQNINKPLLVVQGANDPRVLQVESDELVEEARKGGAPVEYLLFPDEGHGFRKKSNRIKASETYLTFLDTYLKNKKPTGETNM